MDEFSQFLKDESDAPDDLAERASTKRPWTSEEDALVVRLVERYGLKSWSVIAAHFDGRSGKQVPPQQLSDFDGCRLTGPGHADPRALAQPARPAHPEGQMVTPPHSPPPKSRGP